MTYDIHKLFGLMGFEHWTRGGSCTAFVYRLDGNAYILVTEGNYACAPNDNTTQFTVGLYDDKSYVGGSTGDEPCAVNLDLEAAIRCVAEFADEEIDAERLIADATN